MKCLRGGTPEALWALKRGFTHHRSPSPKNQVGRKPQPRTHGPILWRKTSTLLVRTSGRARVYGAASFPSDIIWWLSSKLAGTTAKRMQIPSFPSLVVAFLLLCIGTSLTGFVLDARDAWKQQKAMVAVADDLRRVGKALKELEKSKPEVTIRDLEGSVSLSSGAQWQDLKLYPEGRNDGPIVQYRGPLTAPSVVDYFRSGGILTRGQEVPK